MTISVQTLRPADIIVSTTNAGISAVIRAGVSLNARGERTCQGAGQTPY